MTGETMDSVLRVRLPQAVKARLEQIAIDRNTDISELARQALFEKYPDLRASGNTSVIREQPTSGQQPIPELIDAIRNQTAAINKLISRDLATTYPPAKPGAGPSSKIATAKQRQRAKTTRAQEARAATDAAAAELGITLRAEPPRKTG